MILTLLLESAVRSLGLGIVVGIGLKLFRLRPPAAQRIVWTVVLVSAVLMPLLMQWRAVRVPAPVTALDWIALSAAPAGNGASGARVPPYAAAVPSAIRDWAAIAVDAYVLVACALLLRLMTGLLLTFRLLRTAEVDTEVEDLEFV